MSDEQERDAVVPTDNPHKITLIHSQVWRCARCKTWFIRSPVVVGLSGMGEQCDRCGCSSFVGTPGRPFGPTSKSWDWALILINDIFDDLCEEEKQYIRVKSDDRSEDVR